MYHFILESLIEECYKCTILYRHSIKIEGHSFTSVKPSTATRLSSSDVSDTLPSLQPSSHHTQLLTPPDAGPDVRQEPAISALLRGLSNRTPKPYYIHTSGGGLIWDEPNGEPTTKIWDDVDDIQEMQSLPSSYIHATPDAVRPSHSFPILIPLIHPFLPTPLLNPLTPSPL
jgi:hypothetical protein